METKYTGIYIHFSWEEKKKNDISRLKKVQQKKMNSKIPNLQ